jgi:ribosomal protein L3 glutamine methyltransferase
MNISEAIQQLVTIRDFIRWGYTRMNEAGLYFGHGTDNALDESFALLLHALHLPAEIPDSYLDCRLTESEKENIATLFERRIVEHIPVPYLTHEAWFARLPFYVDERVLIPRSPIAELIEAEFSPWVEPDNVHHILDLCTGSGCIAIACAHAFPHAMVDAGDISEQAIEVAEINIERHGLREQVHAIQSDLFGQLAGRRYDLIVSNPPYVSNQEMQELPDEYRHEPVLGLEAGTAGLDIVKRILREAADHLTEHGVLVVEVGNSEETLVECYPEVPFLWLDFARGGEGVFLLTAAQLRDCREYVNRA